MTLEEREAGFRADSLAANKKWGMDWVAYTQLNCRMVGPQLQVEPITEQRPTPIDNWRPSTDEPTFEELSSAIQSAIAPNGHKESAHA